MPEYPLGADTPGATSPAAAIRRARNLRIGGALRVPDAVRRDEAFLKPSNDDA
jgi:hypothetical protein